MKYSGRNPFDYFDEVYYINLEKRADRREQIEIELASVGIHNATRVVGIEHENPALGCHLSHAVVFQDALEAGYDRILIFEDDAEFFPNSMENMSKSLAALPPEWDMFYLGANLDVYKAYELSPNLALLTGAFATHAYAVRRPLFNRLYTLNNDESVAHNDVEYSQIIIPNYKCYLAMPLIAGQRDSYSDIEKKVMSSNSVFQTRLQTNLVRLGDATNIYNSNNGEKNTD